MNSKILDADTFYKQQAFVGVRTCLRPFSGMVRAMQRSVMNVEVQEPRGSSPDLPPVLAQIAQSVWIGQCALCKSAFPVSKTDRWFYCANPRCQNEGYDHVMCPVQFPANVEGIEEELSKRGVYRLRNLVVGETYEDIVAENRAANIP